MRSDGVFPNVQAYDRGAMFSPDGRIFQVDYAKEAVRRYGATALGMVCSDSIVFVAHKNIGSPLILPSTLQKVFRIDSHIGATYSGVVSDAHHIINIMRSRAQTHRMVYNEAESVETIAREIADDMQIATQYSGIRPYAASLLVGGVSAGPRLYELDPAASPIGCKADAIGSGKKVAEDILVKEYKEGLEIDDAITLGIDIMRKINEGTLSSDNIDVATITKKGGFVMYTPDRIAKYI